MEKIIREIYEKYEQYINEDIEGNKKGALNLRADMERSALYVDGRCTAQTLQIPKVFSDRTIERFKRIVSTTYQILEKVIYEYIHRESFRRLFPFSKELEELILVPNLYDSLLPIARFDIFYNEENDDFHFCEINTDGTSAMNEDRLLNKLIINNPAHQEIIYRYNLQSMELFDSWAQEFLNMFTTYKNFRPQPHVAIVDFLDRGTINEFKEYANAFQRQFVTCEICDIRDLKYENGKLISPTNKGIDAIYRRAVTSDILKEYDKVGPFINAVKDNAVFVAGSFCTQVAHNKWLFYILHREETRRLLTQKEWDFVEAHIPKTLLCNEKYISRAQIIEDKEKYILKPLDSYASDGVYAGVEFDKDKWGEIVDKVYSDGYICQEYCPQYTSKNIDFAWGDGQWHDYINLTGLYVFNGRFAGVYSRQAIGGIVASHRNERTIPTLVASSKNKYRKNVDKV